MSAPTLRIWHDDIRPAPPGWMWARTNDDAKRMLESYDIAEISLDHDLGLAALDPNTPGAIFRDGTSDGETGRDLVRWMCEHERVPAVVTIHSVNPIGARAMADTLNDAGYACTLSPYTHRR